MWGGVSLGIEQVVGGGRFPRNRVSEERRENFLLSSFFFFFLVNLKRRGRGSICVCRLKRFTYVGLRSSAGIQRTDPAHGSSAGIQREDPAHTGGGGSRAAAVLPRL